jgi:hypothetical protein
MMPLRPQPFLALLIPGLLVAACASSPTDPTAQLLGHRMESTLAQDIAANRATLEQLPNGTRVTLAEQSLFSGNGTTLTDTGRYTLASTIEGLLDPTIMQVQVAGSSLGPVGVPDARARAVTQYFTQYGLGPVLQSPADPQVMPMATTGSDRQGLTITTLTNHPG